MRKHILPIALIIWILTGSWNAYKIYTLNIELTEALQDHYDSLVEYRDTLRELEECRKIVTKEMYNN